ncbi:(d)CMP kinase [Anaeromicropila populeti]|uniref:Cytidylate kinase n=1 Tax=Anaeromicropila populeti TaxID=37658 RepID=A0A1I6KGG3_9FIRM|nr:(d)CMP kinase [Anaeromicropila populeti]SFR90244.1 cytidylate kinase [Anaeromicropila populeti]
MGFSIAIDGPAGAGKSTIAKRIAKELGFIYVDTGAMYRAMGLYFQRKNIEDTVVIKRDCKEADITILYENGEQQVILNGENVNGFIRTEEAGKMASHVAKIKEVRFQLVELQRKLSKTSDVVMDGRDIGTHVLPNADLKIYLTASAYTRAERRYKELLEKGETCELEKIEEDIVARDEQDMNREFAPLRQAQDAVLIDSSDLTIDEVVKKIIYLYANKQ